MTRKNRTVADRQQSLQPEPPKTYTTLNLTELMRNGMGAQEFHCTINGYCRTQVFEFPRIKFHPDCEESHHEVYASSTVQGHVTSNLVDYFATSTFSRHYAISPCLRHNVGETDEKIRLQNPDSVPVFLVIEEVYQLTPVEMVKGECSLVDEVVVRNGEKERMLIGGREGEKFVTAHASEDGAWPELPNNQLLVNLVLAGVRVGQQTEQPISKYVDQSCLVTDDGRFVIMMQLTASARPTTVTTMDSTALRSSVNEIRRAVEAMEQDISVPHMALLINAMYRDEYGDDAYQRLLYLQLWKSLVEAGPRQLNYTGDIRNDNAAVAGNRTLRELKDYRDDIAHWWTDTIDENFLSNLQRTINELIRSNYF